MSSDPTRRLMEFGRDLQNIPPSHLPKSFSKVAFLCVNTFESFRFGFGKGPLEDGARLAKVLKSYGFEIYFMKTPHCRNFFRYFDPFLQNTTNRLVIVYLGHEIYMTKDNGSYDEAFTFDDGQISDATIIEHIVEKKNPNSQITMITDACHPGSIWDIDEGVVCGQKIPPKIISIAAQNKGLSTSTTIQERLESGAFVTLLTKEIKNNKGPTPNQIEEKLKNSLEDLKQVFVIGSSSPELLDVPLFYIEPE